MSMSDGGKFSCCDMLYINININIYIYKYEYIDIYIDIYIDMDIDIDIDIGRFRAEYVCLRNPSKGLHISCNICIISFTAIRCLKIQIRR